MLEQLDNLYEALRDAGFYNGRMVGYSKSGYRDRHPGNVVVFNSNIITQDGKVWHGDLDITLDSEKLQDIANETKITFYVLREMDARFGAENAPFDELKQKAVASFEPK